MHLKRQQTVSLLLLCVLGGVHCLPRLPEQNASAIRLVYSLTTNPERVWSVWRTINSLINQEWKPDLIQVNIPHVYLRTNQTFDNLDKVDILKHPLVKVHRCRDYGPITKLMGALETETDPETLIVVVDDDWLYPNYDAKMMRQFAATEPDFAVVGHCGDTLLTNPESDFGVPPFSNFKQNSRASPCCCRFLEGFGSVGYRVRFFQNASAPVISFVSYLDVVLQHKKCFRTDDLVISNYLAMQGIQAVLLFAGPGTIKVWPTKANVDHLALSKQQYDVNGRVEVGHPYYNCSMFMQSIGLSSILRTWTPAEEKTIVSVQEGALMQCPPDRTVWLIQNQTRRAFQSGQAFISMGFDFGSVRKVGDCKWTLFWVPEGEPIF